MFYDPRNVPRFTLIPDGEYVAEVGKVTKNEKVDDKGFKSVTINMQYRIAGPTHRNRVIFHSFFIKQKDSDMEAQGNASFCKFLDCIGMGNQVMNHEDELLGHQFKILVGSKEKKQTGEKENFVKNHYPLSDTPVNLLDNDIQF